MSLNRLNPLIGEILKKCSKCKEEKNIDQFYVSKGNVNFWCKPCYKSWHLARYKVAYTLDEKECIYCAVMYIPKARRETFYCSRICKDLHRKHKNKVKRIGSKKKRTCLHCSKVITQERRSDAKFCSQECNSKAHQLQRKLRTRANETGKRGYLRTEICERDNWICQICKKPVERNAHYPNPQAPSLDHIIPVSKGGSSEPSNLQLTHLVCNLKRGNREL